MRSYFILAIAFMLMLSLSYCGSARRGAPVHAPLNVSSPAVAQGEVVFMTHCHTCHPGGEAGLGPAINNKPLPGFLMKIQVRNGIGIMPAFKEEAISKQDLNNLVAYLKELRSAKK